MPSDRAGKTWDVLFADPGWRVLHDGADFARASTQQAAIYAAKAQAKRVNGLVRWHDRRGRVQGVADYAI